MKLRLFLGSSLILLGVWLASAFNHSGDIKTYAPQKADYAKLPITDQ
ncbi:hypothetical protein [Rubritalea marina]|nr:hypothetical protein [Rubritalea marina]